MIKELVVHLGDTKTGSTSIQNALLQGACQGAGKTIFYPTASHHNALVRTLTRKPQFKDRKRKFERIHALLSESDADIGIISAEHFQMVHPDQFIEVTQEYWPGLASRMRLVAYVRPHAEKLLSAFSERVKLGHHTGTFEEFVERIEERKELIYLPRFSAWRDRFGDRFELRPFVRTEMFRGDPVADFFRFVLGHEDFQIGQVISSNTSLTLPQIALLRALHLDMHARAEANGKKLTRQLLDAGATMGRTVSEHLREQGIGNAGDKPLLPAALANRIREFYCADAAELDAAFFERDPMSDALESIGKRTVPLEQSLDATDYFPPDVIASIQAFGAILSKMLLKDPASFQKMAMGTRLMFSTEQDA